MSRYKKKSLAELNRYSIAEASEAESLHPITLVLDNVRSMQNVGSIFRSADAFSIERILLLGITACPPHREIHKTSLGAEEVVAWDHYELWSEARQTLPAHAVIAPLEQTTHSTPLAKYEPAHRPHVIVLGNEINGVSDEILTDAALTLEIPQYGHKHSLNVATSAGIVLYHICQVHPVLGIKN